MTDKALPEPQDAAGIAQVVGMQMRREIDAFRARDYWRRTLASTPAEDVVEGLVLALSTSRLPCCGGVTINVIKGDLANQLACLVTGHCRGGGS
jgi:hypothetical protein